MKLTVLFLAFLRLLTAQETDDCPGKKSATLLPSFTMTPATESPACLGTTSHSTTKSHTTTGSHGTTKSHTTTGSHSTTKSHTTTGSHGTTKSHRTTTIGTTSQEPRTTTHNPTTTSHRNITVQPTTGNGTTINPGRSTSSPHPGPPPPPSPSPSAKEAVGDYMWTNGSQPCVRLQAQIQMRILYPTQGGGETWGISVLNPNKTKALGSCEGAHPQLLLSFPYGKLSFQFQQELLQNTVYVNYMAVEYNVSFPHAAQWTFLAQNSSLQELQTPLGHSFSCGNASIILSRTFHLDLLDLKMQAAQLPLTGDFGPSFSCPSGHSILLPLIIGLILLGLLTLVLVTFCIVQRRPSTYQPL